MKPNLRVLIIDDHAMMRLGLAEAVAAEPDLTLAGEAGHGNQIVPLYEQHRPDVVIIDFHLPGADGAQCIAQLLMTHPSARVIVFSVSEAEEDIWRAAQAGAMGYVPKSVEIDEVLEAVRRVCTQQTYFPEAIQAKLDARRNRGALTERQLQVLREIVAGSSNKEIAATLRMSDATVKLHISNTLAKLNVADRTQAAIVAVQRGIVRLER